MKRRFQISDETFWGFYQEIEITADNTKEDIINAVILRLRNYLEVVNLEVLMERLDEKDFHICSADLNCIHNNPEQIYYICTHKDE